MDELQSEYKEVKVGLKGLNQFEDPLTMDNQYSPNLYNVMVVGNFIRKRYGYRKLGTSGLPLLGIGMKIYNFIDYAGDSQLLAFTTASVYLYNQSSGAWEDLDSDTYSTTTTTTTTTTDEPPYEYWTLEDSQILTNRVSVATISDVALFSDKITCLAITNGHDLPFAFDGSALQLLDVVYGAEANTKGISEFTDCQEVESLNDHLFLINCTASVDYGRGIFYSVAGDVTNFLDVGSGFQVIADSLGELRCGRKLENNLVLYSDYSISVCRYVGGDVIFIFPTYIQELGLWSPNAIHATAKFHYFIGSDGRIYTYAGTNLLTPIGTLVESVFYDNMNYDRRFLTNLSYDFGRRHLYFFAAKKGSDYPEYYLSLDTQRGIWLTGEFTHSCMSMCSWNDAHSDDKFFNDDDLKAIPIKDISWYCDTYSSQTGYPITIFISDNGNVYEIVNNLMTDDGSNYQSYVESGDISVIEKSTELYGRVLTLVVEASSGNYSKSQLQLQYSIDSGTTWYNLNNLEVNDTMNKYHVSLDVMCRKIRFRVGFIQSSDLVEEDFVLASIGLWVASGKER